MPIRENREYRDLPLFTIEKRDEQEAPNYIVEGYASTFEEYKLFDLDERTSVYERIEPDAFKETDMSDVIFQCDHTGKVFARTSNNTLSLMVDDKGLFTRTDLSRTESARQMFEEIREGMYYKMSFAFTIDQDEVIRESENKLVRVIKRIAKLYDVSAVSFPANDTTNISVFSRSAIDGFIESEKAELLKREKAQELEKAKALYWEV